jgi:glutaredoxin
MMGRAVVGAVLLLCFACASAGQIYKWTDADGHVHFGDHPPPAGRSEAVAPAINTYSGAEVTRNNWVPPSESTTPVARRMVTLYSAAWCAVCRQARAYFQGNGIPFTEYDVENSEKGYQDYRALHGRGVPIILVGSARMNGFSPDAFDAMYRQGGVASHTVYATGRSQ